VERVIISDARIINVKVQSKRHDENDESNMYKKLHVSKGKVDNEIQLIILTQ